jgi:regulatory protein
MNSLEITNIVKKSGKYIVFLNNNLSYKFHYEILLKHNLKPRMTISYDSFYAILNENKLKLCFDQALVYLSIRMHSIYELKQKFYKKGYDKNTIDLTISKCCDLGFIDDDLFAENYLTELKYRNIGSYKAVQMLKIKGIGKEIAENLVSKLYNDPDDREVIMKLLERKKRILSKDLEKNKIKEKLFRYLYTKGFNKTIIYEQIDKFLK